MLRLQRCLLPAFLVLALIFTGCDSSEPGVTAPDAPDASTEITETDLAAEIENRYVVVFDDGAMAASDVETSAVSLAESVDGQVVHTYDAALRGFAVDVPDASAADQLAEDPAVAYVEPDGLVETQQTNPPSWGLDRVDQAYLPLDNYYGYLYAGYGVNAYVIDTGIDDTHPDFGSRATQVVDFTGSGNYDCNGHGTHVAGTIGGNQYGVAKGVNLYGVKVLGCGGGGSYSGVIAGVNWVTKNAESPAVANMSLGGGYYAPLNQAVENSVQSGVTYAIASGNSDADACNFSPASTGGCALTVNATNQEDEEAFFSNHGTCTDIYAPGVEITSTWLNGGTRTIDGTSMASPHVAGVAAKLLQRYPYATVEQVATTVKHAATPGVVVNPDPGSPNRLVHSDVCPMNLVTNPPSNCGTKSALQTVSKETDEAAAYAATIRDFRDGVMRESDVGQQYIERYWTHALTIAFTLASNPDLWQQAHETILATNPVLAEATQGEAVLTQEVSAQVDETLARVGDASDDDELLQAIEQARADLRNPEVMQQFNIFLE